MLATITIATQNPQRKTSALGFSGTSKAAIHWTAQTLLRCSHEYVRASYVSDFARDFTIPVLEKIAAVSETLTDAQVADGQATLVKQLEIIGRSIGLTVALD